MSTTLQRLLSYPHRSVFDTQPQEELAFRLRHPFGATWEVADGVMTAAVGPYRRTYALDALNVTQLRAALVADGFEVLDVSSAYSGKSALVLVEGSGDQNVSNGDHVHAYTSILWALLGSFAGELRVAKSAIVQAVRQMVISQAEGEWLDLWGALYAVARKTGEGDAAFAARIPREVFRLRNNAHGIELAIRDATGFDVRIEEPWHNIFRLDESLLSGADRLYDGQYVGYHLIRPVVRTNVDWPVIEAVIERNRAAGVMVLGPQLVWQSMVVAPDPVVHFGGLMEHAASLKPGDKALLDFAEYGELSVLNHRSRVRYEVLHVSGSDLEAQSWPGDPLFVVSSKYSSSYEVHYSAVQYSSSPWDATNGLTWEMAATWATTGPIVSTVQS